MLVPIHHHIAAFCAVFAQEHADAARSFPTASVRPKWFSCAPPLSGTAATPDPLSSPPVGGTSLSLAQYPNVRVYHQSHLVGLLSALVGDSIRASLSNRKPAMFSWEVLR